MSSDSSPSTAVGIVTSADDQYLYVWSKAVNAGAKELRFNKDSNADIKVGAWVHFDRTSKTGPDGAQTVILWRADCVEQIAPIHQIKLPGGLCFWRASCVVTFCPPDYAPYVQAKASHPGLLGLAYNNVFGHIALLDRKVPYEVGKVYKLRIKRIERAENEVAQAVGTLFCVSMGSMLDVVLEVRDEVVRNRLLDQAPWLREDSGEARATSQDTEVMCECSTRSRKTVSTDGNNNGKVTTGSKLDNIPSADHFYEGIVYDVQAPYVRAYIPQFGISVVALTASLPFLPGVTDGRPDVGTLLRFRLREAEGFIVRLDVPYQAIAVEVTGNATDEQLHEVLKAVNAQKERAHDAYAVPSRPGLLYEGVVYEAEPTRVYVYVSCLHKTAVAFLSGAFDPPVGTLLNFRMKNSEGWSIAESPEVIGVVDNERLLNVYKEVYPQQEFRDDEERHRGDDNVDDSPALVGEQQADALKPTFAHAKNWNFASTDKKVRDSLDVAIADENGTLLVKAPKPTFAAPKNWNFAATDRKATDLLGVAVATANGTTTFYTSLGTVEIPVEAQLGAWVRMDVTLTEGRFVQGDDDVLRIEQLLPPPMDTRVIRGKRVMLVAEVEKHPDGVGNQFLGAVLDPLSLLPRDATYGIFIAELEFDKGCFLVIKYHKPSAFGVSATVPLEASAYHFAEDHRGLEVQEGIKEYAELLQLQHDM